ncbi:hypothetical protein chiPu_0012325 [Chiloscyllium punctatum]|uniref:Uncharacterized protein n=1 Tax=Chiloscyllium punctatum TaxID=137246 RepID=A0A401STY0_CHIPU|nr:hypothetical protein [Chiloscyllium punctatum]
MIQLLSMFKESAKQQTLSEGHHQMEQNKRLNLSFEELEAYTLEVSSSCDTIGGEKKACEVEGVVKVA